jgi:ABC transporter substrate binding protein (PQQ-dependent alcohol dehydrogenase system)
MHNKTLMLSSLALLISTFTTSTGANENTPQTPSTYVIGYLELDAAIDKRYSDKQLYAKYLGQALGRPFVGAEVALKEVKYHGKALGLNFALEKATAKDSADLGTQLEALKQKGAKFILTDLPASDLATLAQSTRDQELALLNISAPDDSLRQTDCQPNLYHLLPNYAMQTDALAQFLVSHKWQPVLELVGQLPADDQWAQAFERSAKRFGLKITEKKSFVLSNDPRERDQNNVALLTGGDQEVIFIADSQGEFSRQVPYHTLKPNLVVGAEGLTAGAWHWSWERHGAPQLNKRFEKKADRAMSSTDWAAWMGVKTIAEAVQVKNTTDFKTLTEYFTAPDTAMDGFKGNGVSFRAWDHQLRQPLLLHTHNAVVDRAPLKGFLHQVNNLDTLGFDERESTCKF